MDSSLIVVGFGSIAVLSLRAGRGRDTGYHLKWLDPLRRWRDNRGTRALNQSLDLGLLCRRH
jgi:hypothetical protein